MNKKILFFIILGIISLPVACSAQLRDYSQGNVGTIEGFIRNIENVTAMIFSAIAVICFVVAGIMFLTAQGDASKLQAARSAFIWGIAGVVVGIIAFSIIAIVGSFLR